MKSEILEKLQISLNTTIQSEEQVVYILSRIRKILEGDNNRNYGVLRFYCNWALHVEINDINLVRDILNGIIVGDRESQTRLAMGFHSFHSDFRLFLQDYELVTTIYDSDSNVLIFNNLMSHVYSDTPLIIRSERLKVSWVQSEDGSREYKIEELV